MDVEGAAPVVALDDAGELQVPVEDPDEPIGDVEDRAGAGQLARDEFAPAPGFRLERGELPGESGPEVSRQVGTDDDAIAFPVLLVFGVQEASPIGS
jgi:hypothetical protein